MDLTRLRALIAAADWSNPEFKGVAEGLVDVVEAADNLNGGDHLEFCSLAGFNHAPGSMCSCDLGELREALATLAAAMKEAGL